LLLLVTLLVLMLLVEALLLMVFVGLLLVLLVMLLLLAVMAGGMVTGGRVGRTGLGLGEGLVVGSCEGLEIQHHIPSPTEVLTHKDRAKDIHLIFTDSILVYFIQRDRTSLLEKGWWCNQCR